VWESCAFGSRLVGVRSKFGIFTVQMKMKTRKSVNTETYIVENSAVVEVKCETSEKFMKFWINIVMNTDG